MTHREEDSRLNKSEKANYNGLASKLPNMTKEEQDRIRDLLTNVVI